MGEVRLDMELSPEEITLNLKFRFTREVRDLLVTVLVAVAGAAATWALTNIQDEATALLALVVAGALTMVAGAAFLKALQLPSEDPHRHDSIARDDEGAKESRRRDAPKRSLGP